MYYQGKKYLFEFSELSIGIETSALESHFGSCKSLIQLFNFKVSSLTKLTSLRPITYTHSADYDDDTSTTHTGFIAHEVEEVFPEFVDGEKDAVWTQEELDARGDPDTTNETVGDPKYQTVAYNKKEWNVYIIRALQQLKAENDALKARIEALEG